MIIKTMSGLLAVVALVWAGLAGMDGRYELKEVHEPVHIQITQGMNSYAYTALKKEIREIRDQIRTTSDNDWRRQLQNDLQDALDRLCMQFPSDRECQ